MMSKNPKVDELIQKTKKWQAEFEKLRAIILDANLTEEVKWGAPCYTLEGNNVVLIHGFKEYCAILFIKGVLLDDSLGILIQQTENVQSARQIRFSSMDDIDKMESVLKTYILNAIEVEKSGVKVVNQNSNDLVFADEFKQKLSEVSGLQAAFDALTPGRKRAYNFYFSAPKKSKTREARVEKYFQKILKGKGLDD